MSRRPHAVLVVLLLVAALLGTTALAADAAPRKKAQRASSERAVWVWNRPAVRSLVSFARQQGVDDIFVSTPGDLASSAELGWFQLLRNRSAAAGIRLHALGAETWWVDDIPAALQWQRSALDTGLFDGIHLDVEPWQHDGWVNDRVRVMEGYVDLLGALAADTQRPVEADIAFWLDQLTVRGQRLDEAVLERVDAVTVMSYRDTITGPDSITGVAANALDAARRYGRPIRLAVETNDLGDDAVALKQTFHGERRRLLDRALRAVDSAEASHPTYRGISIHDYTGWRAMRR